MPTDTKYDIVFLDPPYGKSMVERALASLHKASWLNEEAIIVIEVGAREDVALPEWCELMQQRIYGGSKMIMAIAKDVFPRL